MLSYGDSVLVGLSGGADSVALLRVLLELREEYQLKISCAHINHGIRGETAYRDMRFAEELCRRFGVSLAVTEEDVLSYAKEHHLSAEDAGRKIRYAFFKQQATDKIAVAHTKDDHAETVLMNLLKGNLPLGIAPCREKIIRPLLDVTKEEIYAYLNALGQDYMTDETNFTTVYTRNRVRLELIPYLEQHFNKNFTNSVYHSSRVLYHEQLYLEKLTDKVYHEAAKEENGRILLFVKTLLAEDEVLAKRILRRAYYRICGNTGRISYEQLERLYQLCRTDKKGKQITLPGGIVARLSGDFLIFGKNEKYCGETVVLEAEVPICYGAKNQRICFSKQEDANARFCYPICAKAGDSITVRQRREGDRLYFYNMKIHKKLSDFFIDKKIPLHEREQIPVICVNDSVRIVVGHFYEAVIDCSKDEQYYIIIK